MKKIYRIAMNTFPMPSVNSQKLKIVRAGVKFEDILPTYSWFWCVRCTDEQLSMLVLSGFEVIENLTSFYRRSL